MEIFRKTSCKKMEEEAIESFKIPSIVLMENAGERIANYIKNEGEKFVIIAGVGNNGGDGLVISRKLILSNKKVHIFIVGNLDKCSSEFKINLDILINMKVDICHLKSEEDLLNLNRLIERDTLIIDALFGIGLNRNIDGIYKKVISIINKSEKVFSIDIPSGMDSDTGKALGICVKAYKTFTIECIKRGFIHNEGVINVGEINVINIDIPKELKEKNSEKVYILPREAYIDKIKKRDKLGHKGDFGKVGIIGGSKDFVGAVYIASEAAIRTGSGLVTLITNKDIASILKCRVIEAMVKEYESTYEISGLDKFDVIACGPGLGRSNEAKEVLYKSIKETKCPLVIDADGLNILSENKDILNYIKNRSILTPHLGEMSRLIGKDIKSIEDNKIEISKKFAKENNVILLLKGYNTIITDGEYVYINKTGSSKMASGGMGDCLTGIIASLIGQGLSLIDSALLGAYIHGYSSDFIGKKMYSVSARDIINILPKIIEDLLCEN